MRAYALTRRWSWGTFILMLSLSPVAVNIVRTHFHISIHA